jgi:hypothetical protein
MKIIDINGLERECLEVNSDPAYPGFIKVTYPSPRDPSNPRTEWYPITDFLARNPELKDTIPAPPPPDVTGIVTKAGKDNLKDDTQNWVPNIYKDFTLWISRGTGEAQIRKVTKNSQNTAYIDKPWDTKPDKTSQYVISHNVHDPMPQGNTLPGDVKP